MGNVQLVIAAALGMAGGFGRLFSGTFSLGIVAPSIAAGGVIGPLAFAIMHDRMSSSGPGSIVAALVRALAGLPVLTLSPCWRSPFARTVS